MVKIFIGRNCPLGHADQLYTYKGHILSVGLTEKWQKMTKIACQTPFVYYIQSFTISRQSISINSHEGSWVLFTISWILLYQGLLY